MQELSCNSTKNIYYLSQKCINGSNTSSLECVRSFDDVTMVLRYMHGGWLIVIAILGVLGNSTTLLSIPFAVRRKLHGLDRNLKNTTVFILHLSFIELCWCLVVALPFSYQLLMQEWPFGTFLCKASVMFMQATCGTESLALAVISISRCLALTKSSCWEKSSHKNLNLCLLLFIPWVLSLPSLIPYWLKSSAFSVGWSCRVGHCGTIPSCTTAECEINSMPEKLMGVFVVWYIFAIVIISLITIITCYVLLQRKAITSSIYLKQMGNITPELHKRDMKMTRTIIFLILCHNLCNIPLHLYQGLYVSKNFSLYETNSSLHIWHVLMIFYESQYALNFFIYAGSSDQYRRAYLDYFRYLKRRCGRSDKIVNSGKNIWNRHTSTFTKSSIPASTTNMIN